MSHLTPNTTAATAKLLRRLASTLATPSTIPTPSEVFTTATTANSETLLTALLSVLTPSTSTQTLNSALHTLFDLSNTLPPRHLAPHWRTLCQRLLTLSKHSPNPRTLITLSSLILASVPLSTLGVEQRAVVAGIAQQCLQHALNTLSTHPVQSLCLIHAVIRAAPRELRAQDLDQRLHALLTHPDPKVRSLAAGLSARLVTCVTEKQQQKLFSERVEYVRGQVADITTLLDAFTGGRYTGSMAEKTPKEVCDHIDGVCGLLIDLLDLPIRVAFPIKEVLNTFSDGVRERVVDPYAVVEGVKITHDDLLIIIPNVQRLCGLVIADVAQRVHKVALQMFVKDIGNLFEMRLSKLLLRSRENDGLACIVERKEVYSTIGNLVTSLGTGFLDFVTPRFQELFEIDVALHKQCLVRESVLKVDPVNDIPPGGKSRKRRRQNGRRDSSVGSRVLTKESLQSLESVYGTETSRSVEDALNVALDVIARMFDCRGLLTKVVIKHLSKLEERLLEFLEGKRLSPVLLRAIASAALSGGSKRMTGEASPLLVSLARVSVMAALDTNLSSETRNMALTARAGCEAIIHPRGLPYVKESRIYPTVLENERSIVEKRAPEKNSAKPSENPSSEQNGSFSDQGNAEIHSKETRVERQEGAESEEAGEKNGERINSASDLMEVEDVAEVQPVPMEVEKDFPGTGKSMSNELTETEPNKKTETASSRGDEIHQNGDEPRHPVSIVDKIGVEERRISLAAAQQPEALQKVSAKNTKEFQKEPSSDPVRAEIEKREETRNKPEEMTTPIDHQVVNPEVRDDEDEQDWEREDQALIDSLVFEPSDEE